MRKCQWYVVYLLKVILNPRKYHINQHRKWVSWLCNGMLPFSLCISKWYYICYIEKSDQRQSDIMKHVKKDRSSLFHYVTTKKISFLLWTLKIKGQAWSNYFETVLPSSFSLQFRGFQIKKSLVPLIFLLSIRKGHYTLKQSAI